ncbi:hypothetical protein [Actinomadura parmotrematis]|uniref:DUF5667 domain-containing protein n=1 Tax=Actinomadura parmotrematis TaxID=2864039 RepID=A0ABS7FXZ9_9ACTN|nr:hypothetical protein [Actinomadura parmotrematis]MBW8485315.1 hypothetical protein [Actinomadura parmotrematis]
MQCPTCGTHTPGTVGPCPNCDAPLGAPAAPGLGDRTIVAPPPPSWTPAAPATPDSESESTAPWKFDPGADDEPPARQAAPGALPVPPPPAWGAQAGAEQEPESIVPDSWYAKPRRPEPEPGPQQWTPQPAPPADEATQKWTPQGQAQPMAAPVADATQQQWGQQAPAADGWGAAPQQQQQWAPQQDQWNGQQQWGRPGDQNATQVAPMGGGMPPYGQPGDFHQQGDFQQPGDFQQQRPSGGGPSKPLLIGVSALVAVAVAAVGIVVFSKDDDGGKPKAQATSPSTGKRPVAQQKPLSQAAKEQAAAVNALLNTSADARQALTHGLAAARSCKTLPASVGDFQRVAQRRKAQLARTAALEVDETPNGERMRARLKESYQASLEVDQALQVWALKAQRHCKGKPKPDAGHAPGRAAAEQRATAAKKQFVALWNPVAKKSGQPVRAWNNV